MSRYFSRLAKRSGLQVKHGHPGRRFAAPVAPPEKQASLPTATPNITDTDGIHRNSGLIVEDALVVVSQSAQSASDKAHSSLRTLTPMATTAPQKSPDLNNKSDIKGNNAVPDVTSQDYLDRHQRESYQPYQQRDNNAAHTHISVDWNNSDAEKIGHRGQHHTDNATGNGVERPTQASSIIDETILVRQQDSLLTVDKGGTNSGSVEHSRAGYKPGKRSVSHESPMARPHTNSVTEQDGDNTLASPSPEIHVAKFSSRDIAKELLHNRRIHQSLAMEKEAGLSGNISLAQGASKQQRKSPVFMPVYQERKREALTASPGINVTIGKVTVDIQQPPTAVSQQVVNSESTKSHTVRQSAERPNRLYRHYLRGL